MKTRLYGVIRLSLSGELIDVERMGGGEVYAQPVLNPLVSKSKLALARKVFRALEETAEREGQ